MTPNSTKLPCLFVGGMMAVSGIDPQSNASDLDYLRTIDVAKYFPNQTFIFTDRLVEEGNLQFSRAMFQALGQKGGKEAQFVTSKLGQFQQARAATPDCLLPTSILEEKTMNPFLNPVKFDALFQTKGDKAKNFGLLRALRREWRPKE